MTPTKVPVTLMNEQGENIVVGEAEVLDNGEVTIELTQDAAGEDIRRFIQEGTSLGFSFKENEYSKSVDMLPVKEVSLLDFPG